MIHLLFFVAIMVVFALAEARMDAAYIGDNKPIYHGEGWFRRAGVTAVLMLVMLAGGMDTDALPACALMAYGAFTPVFRIVLNLRRKLLWDYVSESSMYDGIFIAMFRAHAGLMASVVELTALSFGIHLYLTHT